MIAEFEIARVGTLRCHLRHTIHELREISANMQKRSSAIARRRIAIW